MFLTYQECWRILKPGGILALVLKGFTRDGAYVDLPGQTEALLLAAGWLKHDEWRRELWSLSFWRLCLKSGLYPKSRTVAPKVSLSKTHKREE